MIVSLFVVGFLVVGSSCQPVFPDSFTGTLTVVSNVPIANIENNTLLNVFVLLHNNTALFDNATGSLFVSSTLNSEAWLYSTQSTQCQFVCQSSKCLSPLFQPFQDAVQFAQPVMGAPACAGQGQLFTYTDMSRWLGFIFCADQQNRFPVWMSVNVMTRGITIDIQFSSYTIQVPPVMLFQPPNTCPGN
jgi:hypothetical protein